MKDRKGYVYFDKTEKCWYARTTVTDEFGNRRNVKRRGKSKSDAKDVLKTILRQIDDEGERVIDIAKLTFNDLSKFYKEHYCKPAEYIDGKKIAGMRDVRNANRLVDIITSHFGKRFLREITYHDITIYRSKRLKTPTKYKRPRNIATWNREAATLRRMLNVAMREGWILKNPFNCGESLITTSFERRRERILTLDEERRLLEVCSGEREITYKRKGKEITAKIDNGRTHLKALVIGLLDTGARSGEMLKLTWKYVDFQNRLITFEGSTTKTLKTRQVAITQRFYDELLSLWENSNKELPSLVFGIANNVRRSFASACNDAGIKQGGIDGISLHSLRHTAATRLANANLPIQMVGRILGHSQPQTTYRYLSANSETLFQAASILESIQTAPVNAVNQTHYVN